MHAVSTNFAKPTPNIKMTSYYDVINSIYPTIMRLSTAKYWNLLGGIQSRSRPGHHETSSRHWPNLIEKMSLKNVKWSGNPNASVYVRKLDFQANLCKAFAECKNAALLWRLSFGMGSFAKDCLQLLVNRISIKM